LLANPVALTARRLKDVVAENARLRKTIADLTAA
jgi:hypothetical protein